MLNLLAILKDVYSVVDDMGTTVEAEYVIGSLDILESRDKLWSSVFK